MTTKSSSPIVQFPYKQTKRPDHESRAKGQEAPSLLADPTPSAKTSVQKMLHELRTCKAELESQNQELRRTQAELESQNAELRQTRSDLDQAKTHYLELYEIAPVGYCILDEKWLIVEANLTSASLLGTTRPALINQPLSRFINKGDQEAYHQMCQNLIGSVASQSGEFRIVRPDSEIIWMRLECKVWLDRHGKRTLRIVLIDIHKQKMAEIAILDNERFFQSSYTDIALAIVVVDIIEPDRFVFTRINPLGERISGLLQAVWLGKTPAEIFAADKADEIIARFEQCRRSKQVVTYVQTFSLESQVTYWENTLYPLIDRAGQVYRLVKTCQEVTARQALENRLERLEDRLVELIQTKSQSASQEAQQMLDDAKMAEEELLAKGDDATVAAMRRRLDRVIAQITHLLAEARVRESLCCQFNTLTQRERDVMQLIAKGYINKEIANFLHISQRTVEVHRAHLMGKLAVTTVAELIVIALTIGLIDPLPSDLDQDQE